VTAAQSAPLTGTEGRQVVEEGLRAEIEKGAIVPGQRLVESELSERFDVTRGSARAALDALCADGLVERIPNRGSRVRRVDTSEAVEILECRMVLDGLLAHKAAQLGTAEDRDALSANLARMEEAVESGDLLKYSDLIQEHHGLVSRAARHRTGAETAARLQAQIVRHQFRLSLRPERARTSLDELRRVVHAVVARDPGRAEAETRAHLQGVIEAVLAESQSR
jgi:DNA-binding GntR family transcriptional regulator